MFLLAPETKFGKHKAVQKVKAKPKKLNKT